MTNGPVLGQPSPCSQVRTISYVNDQLAQLARVQPVLKLSIHLYRQSGNNCVRRISSDSTQQYGLIPRLGVTLIVINCYRYKHIHQWTVIIVLTVGRVLSVFLFDSSVVDDVSESFTCGHRRLPVLSRCHCIVIISTTFFLVLYCCCLYRQLHNLKLCNNEHKNS